MLITQEQFINAKSRDLIPLRCINCNNTFLKSKNLIQSELSKNTEKANSFCSLKCYGLFSRTRLKLKCENCNKEFERTISEKNKSKKSFCSRHCSGTYNSQHRTTGTRRSKLEKWLEIKLKDIYNNINILFNDKSAILAELDIYIPSLKLAFELNGIFHYEPIFGLEKLSDTEKRDKRKILTCFENNIELCVLDTCSLTYFKEEKANKFLNIICNIINNKLEGISGTSPDNKKVATSPVQ